MVTGAGLVVAPISFRRQIVVPLMLFALAGGLWSLSSPLGSGPDEKDHAIRAYAAIHGDFVGSETALGGGSAAFTAPAWLLDLEPGCYAFQTHVPASCAAEVRSDAPDAELQSRAGLSPPSYHLLTGVPLLVAGGQPGMFGARLVAVGASSMLVAAALVLARDHRSRALLVPAVVLAWTPTSLFLSGVLNPSGLEISSALLTWIAGLTLLDDESSFPVSARFALFTTGSTLFVLTRQLSPLLYLIVGVTLLALASRGRLAELLRLRAARAGLAVIALAGIVATTWLLHFQPLDAANDEFSPPAGGDAALVTFAFGRQSIMLLQMIAWFGWLDLRGPSVASHLWIACTATVILLAALRLSRRDGVVVAALVGMSIALPTLIEAANLRTHGIVWQGRYTLPVAMGCVLVAAARASFTGTAAELVTRVGRVVCVVAPLATWLCFGAMLRRNSIGTNEPFWRVVTHPVWDPPTTTWFLLATSAAAAVALALYLRTACETRAMATTPAR